MEFEWDPNKSKTNLGKHGLLFECALSVFEGFHMTVADTRQDYGEKRFCTMGELQGQRRVVIIAHTSRGNKIRIISMRRANRREQKIFYDYQYKYHRGEYD